MRHELGGLLRNELLVSGKVEKIRDTEYGPSYTVLSGFTGPNGRHATVVSCWLIEDREGVGVPKAHYDVGGTSSRQGVWTMTAAMQNGLIRTTAEVKSIFDSRTIPAEQQARSRSQA